ncbi:hypothetical protein StoSoilB13_33300 (plasmid) [Arthrobacter sp. StoSoilB13]|nr:hypothetical protein StoSoilB13_33300 [Arthrobacter sp. StoSoilB13]
MVRVLVPLYLMDGQAGRQKLPVLDALQGKEETGCANERIHSIGIGAPCPVGALLEQPAGVRPCGVAVILAFKGRFAKRGLYPQDLGIGWQAQLFRRHHDGRSITELDV